MATHCRNGSECCMKCPHLTAEERVAAHEHLRPSDRQTKDLSIGGYCPHYCGKFEADSSCRSCRSRELIKARADEIRAALDVGEPYERIGWECHGL
jgi:hypothetical protein